MKTSGLTLGALVLLGALGGCQTSSQPEGAPAGGHLRAPISPAETCQSCHPQQYEEWNGSLMSYLSASPFFNGLEISVQELVGRNLRACPGGAGVLRRAPRLDEEDPSSQVDPDEACFNGDLPITGAGGEHWCVNCHVPAENTLRSVAPPGERQPLVPGMPTWKKSDPGSRRPVVDILDEQARADAHGLGSAGAEGKTMMQGASCDVCHQVSGPVLASARAFERGALADYLAPDTYQGNPIWTSFTAVEEGDVSSDVDLRTCLDALGEDPLAAPGEACVYLFREEGEEGPGIGNSGYFLEADPTRPEVEGELRFGPRLETDGVAPFPNTFHASSHAAVALDGDPLTREAAAVGDPRYTLPGDPERVDFFRTSNFCGTCHDVRILGADTRFHSGCDPAPGQPLPPDCLEDELAGVEPRFEPYKRLRDAYSEHRRSGYALARGNNPSPVIDQNRTGESVVTCQDCHMSTYPAVFLPQGERPSDGCEEIPVSALEEVGQGELAEALRAIASHHDGVEPLVVKPGCYAVGQAATNDGVGNTPPQRRRAPHYFTGVDIPLDPRGDAERFLRSDYEDVGLDPSGIVLGEEHRRDLLLKRALSLELEAGSVQQDGEGALRLGAVITNVGAGHRVPAGFTQEREIWLEVVVTDLTRSESTFECGQGMADRLADEYARIAACVSALRFGEEPEPARCQDVLELGTPTVEEAAAQVRAGLGVAAHQGALLDHDHTELVIGGGEEGEVDLNGDGHIDHLDYEALFERFDPLTGALIDESGLRLVDDSLFLLDRVEGEGGTRLRVAEGPHDVQGELVLVERADGLVVDEDLPDKVFTRIRINDELFTAADGALVGTYGLEVIDGAWPTRIQLGDELDEAGALPVRSSGLINFQNGFLRCVACCPPGAVSALGEGGAVICLEDGVEVPPPVDAQGQCCRGEVDAQGVCCEGRLVDGGCVAEELPRAFNLTDGVFDIESGLCRSNLVDAQGQDLLDPVTGVPAKFLEVFSPIGALDPDRGGFKAADGIINERSIPPGIPYHFDHQVALEQAPAGPVCVEARLNFRAFPPYLIRMFAGRELVRLTQEAQRPADQRRSQAVMTLDMADQLDVVVMASDFTQVQLPGREAARHAAMKEDPR